MIHGLGDNWWKVLKSQKKMKIKKVKYHLAPRHLLLSSSIFILIHVVVATLYVNLTIVVNPWKTPLFYLSITPDNIAHSSSIEITSQTRKFTSRSTWHKYTWIVSLSLDQWILTKHGAHDSHKDPQWFLSWAKPNMELMAMIGTMGISAMNNHSIHPGQIMTNEPL